AGSFTSKNVGLGIGVTASDSVGGASAGNYTLTEPLGLVANITPATLTYTAAAASFTTGQTPSGLSGTLSGFVLADNRANATAGTLVWTTTAAAGSQPGHYPIDGGGLTATNYVFVEAPSDATALTLQSGSSPVIPPVIPPLSGPDAATLSQAQTAAGTLEAELLSSQTSIQVALPVLNPDVAMAQSLESDHGVNCADVPGNGIVIDKRAVINAMVPSLRIVCGGVKLPDNVVEVNAR
ncbi:MAG TPA: MBG domain-containing protein, partial [Steroidobacteraceae bacterium]|nr:MBG domain-containing protein [Steroidobacteraceae bacterium]